MGNSQLELDTSYAVPVFKFLGNCTVEGLSDLNQRLTELNSQGHSKFVFDFSGCKLLNSPAMGELLDAILLVDRDFEGHIVVSGLDSLKETLFTISGIIPLAQEASDVEAGVKLLTELQP
ncbi:MAG: hypothetical protein Kow0029_24910 [Candidatus Rifleibacteriota bacterium]